METFQGKLLLAGPDLWDPNFRRTVVLVGKHDDEGAVGVVLNRPAGVPVAEAAPALARLVGDADPLFLGGPVRPQAAVVLGEFEDPDDVDLIAFGSVGFLVEEDPDEVFGIRRARVFAGYAGWGPGQLEAELEEEGSWIVEPALPQDVFTSDPDRLWSAVMRRKGRDFHMLSTMPFDPGLN